MNRQFVVVSRPNSFAELIQTLRSAGLVVPDSGETPEGFPLVLNLAAWPSVVLDVPEPGVLALFDSDVFGVAVVDPGGRPRALWGVAASLPVFTSESALLESPVGGLVEEALQGRRGTAYLDGFRFHASAYVVHGSAEAIVLVTKADEEAQVRESSRGHQLSTIALKRIGRALSSKQSLRSLALPALHAIYATYDLAAAFLWVRSSEEAPISLLASIGTNRALSDVQVLAEGCHCIAALAAEKRQRMLLKDVKESPLTAALEARVCTSDPGAAIVLPLVSGKRLIGVLELVSRRGDSALLESEDIFATIAEHLTLAIDNAILFENAERLAAHDPLTGIANHRRMQEFLAAKINEAQRSGECVGAVMVDVDHFRSFNEEEGHDAGDQVLKLVAKALESCVRNYDLAARYGGEEFTLILSNADESITFDVAERARTAIEDIRLGDRAVTASFGCAVYPVVCCDAASLLKAADKALYEAKSSGRNCTVVFGRDAA